MYQVLYRKNNSILVNGKWVDKPSESWVDFYPLGSFGAVDTRENLLENNDTIYGKAMVSICGNQPVWVHRFFQTTRIRHNPQSLPKTCLY